ncbi:hypothetical protein QFC22_000520 [Naganishia vaughanmartiniae]|uniref:Uncharacterized protein n=1 Tax=Naganishia vaughanmartiniae TaxID=1424756 RepID=A0ACC2XNI4_9TREE|nr:hypothetical protein QFC22_000520 [Naganishia vaughanmartiniae]
MIDLQTVKLNDGVGVPLLGYGTGTAVRLSGKEKAVDFIKMAYSEAKLCHMDCAQRYFNEESIAVAMKDLGLKREEVFITTKTYKRRKLDVEEVDLFLIHVPDELKEIGLGKAWEMMEQLQCEGKARSIGVSNYRIADLEETLKTAKIVPSVNQTDRDVVEIEVHPYVFEKAKPLIDYRHQKGIAIASYAALASIVRHPGGPVDQVVKDIAEELSMTEDQVLLKWAHQVTYGGIVITTSLKKERLQGQVKAFATMPYLSDTQVRTIADAGKKLYFRQFVSI